MLSSTRHCVIGISIIVLSSTAFLMGLFTSSSFVLSQPINNNLHDQKMDNDRRSLIQVESVEHGGNDNNNDLSQHLEAMTNPSMDPEIVIVGMMPSSSTEKQTKNPISAISNRIEETVSPTFYPTRSMYPTVKFEESPSDTFIWIPDPPQQQPSSSTPSSTPSQQPSHEPSSTPSLTPSSAPSSAPSSIPSQQPTNQQQQQTITVTSSSSSDVVDDIVTYQPGNLTTFKLGLLLSEGLDTRVVATSNETVQYDLGLGISSIPFHDQPDGAAIFVDTDSVRNPNGWIYVSNAEVPHQQGGVGALKFDQDGNLLDYKMLLNGTSRNCGGGVTPWKTWVSCEEVDNGQLYQVDPTGERPAQLMSMASEGGVWESFAHDVRNENVPRFFVTEDHHKGTLRRFTPNVANWDEPWQMLHDEGTTDYLVLFPNATNNGGTYTWTKNFTEARVNAELLYPHSEGIDVYGSILYFVCKKIKMIFTLDLDNGTYFNHTTKSGLFDGAPDQMQRILGDGRGDLLYFTEEGGRDAGIHARDQLSRFYTILESPVYEDETTGLAFSPDGRFMMVAYQDVGVLYQVWRKDGLPFYAAKLDVKYHSQS